jgi:acyl-CoA dehydrogenase
VARVTGDYTTVRRQFGLAIGRFQGIEEPLSRIGGLTYLMDAARIYTCAAVDRGEKPSVVSAIAKYQFTELARKIVNDGMDILGGAGICRGPRNLLANLYTAMPIPITVEGSNILTRTMMIFGQGVIRAHPYIYAEIKALQTQDVSAFDQLLWQHLGFILKNATRAKLLSLSRGHFAAVPVTGPTARYYQKLAWASANFALLTDLVLLGYGGSLKRQEKLTGRLADIVSWMYLATATLRRFEAEGNLAADLPLVEWGVQYSLAQIQLSFEGIFSNLPLPSLLRLPLMAWARLNPIASLPQDHLGSQIAQRLQTPDNDRDRLTQGIHIPTDTDQALGRLENACQLCHQADSLLKTIKTASQAGKIPGGKLPSDKPEHLLELALAAGIISATDLEIIHTADIARTDTIQVDAFILDEYLHHPTLPNPEHLASIA